MSQNYNINMKKFNGTDYDGLLPLAYNALNSQQLDGKTFNEIQNLLDARAQISTGSYVGTGTYGENNPTIINCGFKPKMIIIGTVDTALPTDYPYYYLWKNGTQIGKVEDKNFKVTNSLDVIKSTDVNLTNLMYIFYDQTALAFKIMESVGQDQYRHYYFLIFSLSNTGIRFWCDEYGIAQSSYAEVGAGIRDASQQHNKSGVTYQWIAVH